MLGKLGMQMGTLIFYVVVFYDLLYLKSLIPGAAP
jgi:hypothetical protein